MYKSIFAVFLMIYSFYLEEDYASNSNRAYYLAGNGIKSWSLNSTSPNLSDCKDLAMISSDNVYSFSSDGTFEFDNGEITEDPSCEDCCTDLVDIVGRWEFTGGETGIRVTILHEKGNSSNAQSMVLFDAKIDMLTDDVLKLNQADPSTGVVYRFEFHKK